MKKMRLRPFVKISIVGVFSIVCAIVLATTSNDSLAVSNQADSFVYVNDYIFDTYYPVVNSEEKLIKPFTSETVSIEKNFYDKDADEKTQQDSIIYYEDIYMQNSGIDYKSEEEFDVVASLSGTVTNISDDTLLGKTIEIRNSSEIIVMYQSLGNVLVKKGDVVTQGQIIAKSGTCNLNNGIKQGLHIEIYKNGSVINPEKYYDKSVKELGNN